VHYWADLQSVHRFFCYDNSAEREMSASACARSVPGFDLVILTQIGLSCQNFKLLYFKSDLVFLLCTAFKNSMLFFWGVTEMCSWEGNRRCDIALALRHRLRLSDSELNVGWVNPWVGLSWTGLSFD